MPNVLVDGVEYPSRAVRVTSRMDGDDASFEISPTRPEVDPVLFNRPSAVEIYETIQGTAQLLFEGFVADVEDRKTTATVQCVDGKKMLEKSILEANYPAADDTVENHAEALLSDVRNRVYYAPELDLTVGGQMNVGYNQGQHLRGIFDELFREFEWVVRGGKVVVRYQIGRDLTDSVLIRGDAAVAKTDLLGIANVIVGNSFRDAYTARDGDSIAVLGRAYGFFDSGFGKSGAALERHVAAVLEQKKEARAVWATEKVLKEFLFLQGGDTVSVDLPSTVLNTSPSELRVAAVTYDFDARRQTLVLSSDALPPWTTLDTLKDLREKVRDLEV